MKKKMIAPIVIGLLIIIYYLTIALVIVFTNIPIVIKFIIGGISVIIAIAMICTVRSRIQEIRRGEEDDLSKY